jgi:hypothetical protein
MFANLNTIETISKEQVKQVAPSVFTKTEQVMSPRNTHTSQPSE